MRIEDRRGKMRRLGYLLGLVLLSAPVLAQEQEDFSIAVTETASGATFDYRIGVDRTLVSEDYLLTRLTCRKGVKDIDLLLPITRADAVGQDGSTLRKEGNVWHLTLKAGKIRIDKTVTFEPVADRVSHLREGTVVAIVHGDKFWKALIDPRGDQLVALTGGFGEYEGIPDDANLNRFEAMCGLKR